MADCQCSFEVRPYHYQDVESKHSSTESEYTLDEKEEQKTKITDVPEDMTRKASSSLDSSEESVNTVAPPKVITLLEGSCMLIANLHLKLGQLAPSFGSILAVWLKKYFL